MFKEYIKPLLVLTAVCLFFSAALAIVNSYTEPVIAEAAQQRAVDAMRSILPEATGFVQIEHKYPEDTNGTVREAYRAENDVGYVFIAAANGYDGEIRIICAMDNDGRIISVKTLSHTETVGIGTVIEDESFLSQFDGKDMYLEGVDTVTGATISTKAFISALDGVLNVYNIIMEIIMENG